MAALTVSPVPTELSVEVPASVTPPVCSVPLTGVAALQRSPEEAAILAALQATNRLAAL